MKEKLFFFSLKHPLLYILSLAIVLRILAVIFTSGYMIDDHYFNYYNIPLKWLDNPWLVYGVRLALGAFSLLIITLSYRITKIIADKTTALEIALLLAVLWNMPYLSVHPLPQIVCLPFLLYGTLLIIKQDYLLKNKEIEKFHRTSFLIAGFVMGLGFAVYYQSIIFYIGILIALFILKNWKGAMMTLIGYLIAVLLTQTIVDIIIWHRPFVNIGSFFSNIGEHLVSSPTGIHYTLIGVLVYNILPPLSILLIVGLFRVWRKYTLLFMPTIIVLLFYIIFPNYWFYLYMLIPTFIIAGFVGWKELYKKSSFWDKNYWLVLTCYLLFAVLNTAALFFSFLMPSYLFSF